jgi:gliding motility-associated lipoprotein GldD
MRNFFLFTILALFYSCKEDVLPKPKAYLSLSYPEKKYEDLKLKRPYSFKILQNTEIKDAQNNWLTIKYPSLKASIDITYRPVKNNLRELLIEAEKLVFKHTSKAEQIIPKDFINKKKRVFGSLFQITGNAASHIQFHITDSTHHFIKGSLYFYAKPNYDSILPAVNYIKEDVLHLIETFSWEKESH